MDAAKMNNRGNLSRLSPELRIEIFKEALHLSRAVRRPRPSEDGYSDAAALLKVSSAIYSEAVNLFYRNNTFKLSLHDVETFSNAEDFCQITTIKLQLIHNIGRNGEGGIRRAARKFIDSTAHLAARTNSRVLNLRRVEIWIDDLSLAYLQDLRNDTVGGRFRDIDVGTWSVTLGQSFAMTLLHRHIREAWEPCLVEGFKDRNIEKEIGRSNEYKLGEIPRHLKSRWTIQLLIGNAQYAVTNGWAFFAHDSLVRWMEFASVMMITATFRASFREVFWTCDKACDWPRSVKDFGTRGYGWVNQMLLFALERIIDVEDE